MQQRGSWIGLFLIALIVIAAGIRGQGGILFAVFFAPSIVTVEP